MYLEHIIFKAKNSDKNCIKYLYEISVVECKPILYKYLSKGLSQGISYEDLDMLVVLAFYNALMDYEEGGLPFFDFVKYKYLKYVLTEIRTQTKHNIKTENILVFDPDDKNDNLTFHSSSFEERNVEETSYDQEFIVNMIIDDKIPGITVKERNILMLFLEGYNLSEISKRLNRDYSETNKSYKRAIKKIRRYVGLDK